MDEIKVMEHPLVARMRTIVLVGDVVASADKVVCGLGSAAKRGAAVGWSRLAAARRDKQTDISAVRGRISGRSQFVFCIPPPE